MSVQNMYTSANHVAVTSIGGLPDHSISKYGKSFEKYSVKRLSFNFSIHLNTRQPCVETNLLFCWRINYDFRLILLLKNIIWTLFLPQRIVQISWCSPCWIKCIRPVNTQLFNRQRVNFQNFAATANENVGMLTGISWPKNSNQSKLEVNLMPCMYVFRFMTFWCAHVLCMYVSNMVNACAMHNVFIPFMKKQNKNGGFHHWMQISQY